MIRKTMTHPPDTPNPMPAPGREPIIMTPLENAQLRNLNAQSNKAELETLHLKRPIFLRTVTWASIVAGLVGLTAGALQLSDSVHKQRKAELDLKLSQIDLAEAKTKEAGAKKSVSDLESKEISLKSQISTLEKRQEELQQYKKAAEETAKAEADTRTAKPVNPAEVQAAKIPPTDPEKLRIDEMATKLFSSSGSERTTAYTTLTNELRTKGYAINKILELGRDELAKPPETQDFIGLYHTIVTLTDMSRAITQLPEYKDAILAYGEDVATAIPRLKNRVAILKNRINSPQP